MRQPRKRWHLGLAAAVLAVWAAVPGWAADKPVIVLTAFGTTTEAFATYDHFEKKVRERFPEHELRWAFTSHKVRHKVAAEQGRELKDLGTVLRELKAQGRTRVAIQSLHIVPGEEWEKKVVSVVREVPGLKAAVGKPLLSSPRDQERALAAVAATFPPADKKTVVLLMAHGSPAPSGEKAYVRFARLLTSRYPHAYLASVEGKPEAQAAFARVRKANPDRVVLMPFMFVAGEHVKNDLLGEEPDSWKSQLLKQKPYRIEGITRGLGYLDGIAEIFLDHLAQALKEAEGKK
ncbi:MAG: sirohydrochlorin cobaltochelatase [Syntrophobacterales bacterium]|nr:sirohydrochlorin cobaltochelatase [Syntrophobacterales bacterium]